MEQCTTKTIHRGILCGQFFSVDVRAFSKQQKKKSFSAALSHKRCEFRTGRSYLLTQVITPIRANCFAPKMVLTSRPYIRKLHTTKFLNFHQKLICSWNCDVRTHRSAEISPGNQRSEAASCHKTSIKWWQTPNVPKHQKVSACNKKVKAKLNRQPCEYPPHTPQ